MSISGRKRVTEMTPELFEAIKQMYERLSGQMPKEAVKIYTSSGARGVLGDFVNIGDDAIPVVVKFYLADVPNGDGTFHADIYMGDFDGDDTDLSYGVLTYAI